MYIIDYFRSDVRVCIHNKKKGKMSNFVTSCLVFLFIEYYYVEYSPSRPLDFPFQTDVFGRFTTRQRTS